MVVPSLAAAVPILTRPVAARAALAGDFEAVLKPVRPDGVLRRGRDLTIAAIGREEDAKENLYPYVDVSKVPLGSGGFAANGVPLSTERARALLIRRPTDPVLVDPAGEVAADSDKPLVVIVPIRILTEHSERSDEERLRDEAAAAQLQGNPGYR